MSTIINADTSDGLKFTSDTSGEIKLQSAGTDIATVNSSGITMASGKVLAPTGPAFSAYLSANQNVSNNVLTKIQFDTEEFDTNSNYDNATNYRFTPTVAGYYQVSGGAAFSNLAGRVTVRIYKNGTQFKNGSQFTSGATLTSPQSYMSALVYMNGTTDYIEMYGFQNGGNTETFTGGENDTYFQAVLVRAS